METRHFWQDNGHAVKYESFNATEEFRGEQLGFAAPSEDEDYQAGYLRKGKVSRQDPMSHRIIEKRRRDRMNNCLADLSRLIPPEYLKKGRGRVEKTEIIEMAIRHLKFLQERANGLYDGLALGDYGERPRENRQKRPPCSSSETMSSSSSQGYVSPQSLNTRRPEPPPAPKPYEQTDQYPRECDRVKSVIAAPNDAPPNSELMALDGCHKREPTLRNIRKPEQGEDFLHSYKFKNSIERRFSRSQDCEATDMTVRGGPHKNYGHKRRRVNKTTPSTTSNSNSGSVSTEDTRDTSPQETSNDSTHHHYEKPLSPAAQYVPVFALNSIGKYYVPLSVDYSCLARQLGPHDALAAHAAARAALHPITIHVNFQPCLDQLVKREPGAQEWRPA